VLWVGHGALWGFGFTAFACGTLGFAERRRNGRIRLPLEEPDPLPPQRFGLPGFLSGLAVTVVAVLIVRQFALEARNVPTASMQPTIMGNRPHAGGDHVLVNRLDYRLRDPRRWEIAVFAYPLLPQVTFVKRVIGLPGETVEIRGGDIWVDGVIASKPPLVQQGLWQEVFPRPNLLAKPKSVQVFGLSEDDGWRKDGDGLRVDTGTRTTVALASYAGPRRRGFPTHDLRLSVDVEPLEGGSGHVVLIIDAHGKSVTLSLPYGGASAPEDGSVEVEGGASEQLAVRVKRAATLELTVVEGVAEARLDGRLIARLPAPVEGRGRPRVRFGASGKMRFPRIRVERDIIYEAKGTALFENIPDDAFVVLGDNTKGSHDSRLWQAREYHLTGRQKPIVATLSAPDPETGKEVPNVRRKDGRYALTDVDGVRHEFAAAQLERTVAVKLPYVRRRHLLGRAALIHWPWTVHEAGFRPRVLP